MGESKRRRKSTLAGFEEGGEQPQVVDTLGGRMHVRWDASAAAKPHGQLVCFAEFFAAPLGVNIQSARTSLRLSTHRAASGRLWCRHLRFCSRCMARGYTALFINLKGCSAVLSTAPFLTRAAEAAVKPPAIT
jgi:hypothetical protein